MLEDKQAAMPGFSVSYSLNYYEAERSQFPNTSTPPFGIDDPSVKWALVRYCPECRKARGLWLEEQRQKHVP
jgi:hypothetical protein